MAAVALECVVVGCRCLLCAVYVSCVDVFWFTCLGLSVVLVAARCCLLTPLTCCACVLLGIYMRVHVHTCLYNVVRIHVYSHYIRLYVLTLRCVYKRVHTCPPSSPERERARSTQYVLH